MAKVFVGNFSFAINEEKLKEFFSRIGTVTTAKVMTESAGGKSRGFGFVEFATEEEAKQAIADLNGANWDGRIIKVSEDRGGNVPGSGANAGQNRRQYNKSPRPEGKSTGSGYSGGSGGSNYAHKPQQQAAMGYFRAQPLDLGIKKKRKQDIFVGNPALKIDYKNPKILRRFMSERGKVLSRRMTGLTATNQRLLTVAIRRAQQLALLPIVNS